MFRGRQGAEHEERRFPDLVDDGEQWLESSFEVPTECLGDVAAKVRAAGRRDDRVIAASS